MAFNGYFVSYDEHNHIANSEATFALVGILMILSLVIIFTTKWGKTTANSESIVYFRHETSEALRGIAILCLLLGHFALKCVEGVYSFELAGRWSVIIFLFTSGFGLTKKYAVENLPSNFFVQRISKLLPSTSVTMAMFIVLDFILLDRTYSWKTVILNLLGIITTRSADGSAWYITYILVLYLLYFLTSIISCNKFVKIIILYCMCSMCSILIWKYKQLSYYLSNWPQYTIVFPSAVAIGLYFKLIYDQLTSRIRIIQMVFLFLLVILLLYNYTVKIEGHIYTGLVNSFQLHIIVSIISDFLLILLLLFLTILFDYFQICSSFLAYLGRYSLEIFLLHLPFMEKYDFFLFRKPLLLMLILYISFILIISIAFKKIIIKLSQIFKLVL